MIEKDKIVKLDGMSETIAQDISELDVVRRERAAHIGVLSRLALEVHPDIEINHIQPTGKREELLYVMRGVRDILLQAEPSL